MTRAILTPLLAVAMAGGLFALDAQQAPADWLGNWEQRVAAPSYGLAMALWTVQTNQGNAGATSRLLIPGADVRIFNGANATQGGGFFTGVEVGATAFFNVDKNNKLNNTSFEGKYPGNGGTPGTNYYAAPFTYKVDVEGSLGMVYALAKYGYRLDLGFDLIGLSVGAELGMGARLAQGGLHLSINETDSQTGGQFKVQRDFDNASATNLILDGAAEATLRLGKNFRFFARAGAVVTPEFFANGNTDNRDYWNAVYMDPIDHSNASQRSNFDYQKRDQILLSTFRVEQFPIIPEARVGFALSY